MAASAYKISDLYVVPSSSLDLGDVVEKYLASFNTANGYVVRVTSGRRIQCGAMCCAHSALRELTALRNWGPCVAPSSSLDLGEVGEDSLSSVRGACASD